MIKCLERAGGKKVERGKEEMGKELTYCPSTWVGGSGGEEKMNSQGHIA